MIRRSGGLDSAFATLSALSVCAETNFAGSPAAMSCAIYNYWKYFSPLHSQKAKSPWDTSCAQVGKG